MDRYFEALLPPLSPLQSTQGDPIIAFQIENEYGAYGNDVKYLTHLRNKTRSLGIDSFLFTSDHGVYLDALPDLFKTANFGSRPAENFSLLRKHQPEGPLTCVEFWAGWFDQYGQERPKRDPEELASVLDEMLGTGASVNFYMFHGGTNFGFLNGANSDEKGYDPRPTSYDYGALLTEAGDITPKYEACQRVLAKHGHVSTPSSFSISPRLESREIFPAGSTSLWGALPFLGSGILNPPPCFLNGFNLGRYWNRGPHQSLFIPQPLLKQGTNSVVVFELEKRGASLRLEPQPTFCVNNSTH